MALELPVGKQVSLGVIILDAANNPARVDGVPVWTVDNTDVLSVEAAADGMSCVVKTIGPLSATAPLVTFSADADLGAGVKPLIGTFTVTVTAGEAVRVEITPTGPPTDQA